MSAHIRVPGSLLRQPSRTSQFLTSYQQQIRRRRSQGDREHPVFNDPLDYIANEDNLSAAFDYCMREGGAAPGADGLGYDYYAPRKWEVLRGLQNRLRSGEYEPGSERLLQMPKPNGGVRSLVLENIPARIAQRGVMQILEPIVDPEFVGLSFGGRTGFGVQHALALAEHLIGVTGATMLITEDLKTAFDLTPPQQALKHLPPSLDDPGLSQLLRSMLNSKLTPGLRQGAATSSPLLNAMLDRKLDLPWAKLHPDVPLIRYIDDVLIVVPASKSKRAAELYADLQRIVTAAGYKLKGTVESSVHELPSEASIEWLGMAFRRGAERLKFGLMPHRREQLIEAIADCHFERQPQIRANQVLLGTINHFGPAYHPAAASEFLADVLRAASDLGFQELSSTSSLVTQWGNCYTRWLRLRAQTPAWFERRRYKKGFTVKPFSSLTADGSWRRRFA